MLYRNTQVLVLGNGVLEHDLGFFGNIQVLQATVDGILHHLGLQVRPELRALDVKILFRFRVMFQQVRADQGRYVPMYFGRMLQGMNYQVFINHLVPLSSQPGSVDRRYLFFFR